jgi:hypothetical protein
MIHLRNHARFVLNAPRLPDSGSGVMILTATSRQYRIVRHVNEAYAAASEIASNFVPVRVSLPPIILREVKRHNMPVWKETAKAPSCEGAPKFKE